jgi:ketosteroid isomerase-like protein
MGLHCVSCAGSAARGADAPSTTQDSAEAQAAAAVTAREQAWADALVANDLATVDEIMHPAFRLVRTYADGVIDKQTYLEAPGMSASCVDITSSDIRIVAGDVAVAQLTMTLDWQQAGRGPLPPHFVLTDTWWRDEQGVWRVLSRVSQLADEPPPGVGTRCAGSD